jgi:hypothetical protein
MRTTPLVTGKNDVRTVGHRCRSRPRFIGPGCDHQRPGGFGEPLGGHPEDPVVFTERGNEPRRHSLQLEPENVEGVGPLNRVFDSGKTGNLKLIDAPRHEAGGPAHADLRPQLG